MLGTAWTRATSIPIAGLVLSWIDGTVAEPRPPVCLSRHWRDVEASFLQWPVCVETRWSDRNHTATPTEEVLSVTVSTVASSSSTPPQAPPQPPAESSSTDERHDPDADTDSLLDNANFLSFEDWKKQNLAKVGQSAENVGGNRRAGAKDDRRRPTGINNALDSLGDDVEIELDFGGFGADAPETARPTSWGARVSMGEKTMGGGSGNEGGGRDDSQGRGDVDVLPHGLPRTGGTRGKDAGTTCKERFNYASFDCAATVLKTNPECKGSSSVLIENKDSYMLNECRAQNKFLILELCDDILVDTVVLANYEFFSSIFRTFRVSVADRYPPKPDQWRELGVYEARNTREVQAFAVENPLIWARYVRIEFLTHYGHEFYCPVSLIRVHGTTMLEEYKHDGDAGRGEDEVSEQSAEVDAVAGELQERDSPPPAAGEPVEINSLDGSTGTDVQEICLDPRVETRNLLLGGASAQIDICGIHDTAVDGSGDDTPVEPAQSADDSTASIATEPVVVPQADVSSKVLPDEHRPKPTAFVGTHPDATPSSSSSTTISEAATQNSTSASDPKPMTSKDNDPVTPPEATRPTGVQPPAPNPTTQESFFKSVNKRLQMLESNSTLSLLYIEEQSRILRDAFNKVEKRQLAKTSTFLESLNVTVLNELKQFREQYDQVWKSVALEFEHQRIQYHQEIYSISGQLGVLADELVFQKRVLVIQSMMVLFCFALVLFSRGTVSSYIDFPSVQNMVSRSYSLRSTSPPFESPSVSPSSTRPASSYRGGAGAATGHRRNISEDSQETTMSPTIEYSPPTPTSEDPREGVAEPEKRVTSDELSLPEMTSLHLRSRSSPPVMNGVREEEEEAAQSPSVSSSSGDEALGVGVGLS